MKRLLLALLILLTASPVWAQEQVAKMNVGIVGGGVPVAAGGCGKCTVADPTGAGLLVCEQFETATTGYDGGTWVPFENGGSISPVDTTVTILRGTQQLKLLGTGSNNTNVSHDITESSTVWAHITYRPTDATPATAHAMIAFYPTVANEYGCTGTAVSYLHFRTDGAMRGYHGTVFMASDSTVTPIFADGVIKHLWIRYSAGTGANGVLQMYWGATGTRPALASTCLKGPGWGDGQECSLSTGDATGTVKCIGLREYGGTTGGAYFDSVIIDDAEITDVCTD
jgi:hypothetical protein